MSAQQVMFASGAVRCAADLYLPEGASPDRPGPAVVLGHSGVMVKEALADFAPQLAAAGFVAMAIDYQTVGASEGEPRGQMYPERQVDDFRSAVSYLETRPEVDAGRIAAWGVSLGGSVAIQAAVFDRRIKTVVAHSPSVFNGWEQFMAAKGRVGFKAIQDSLAADWRHRRETGASRRVPFMNLEHEEAHKAQEESLKRYPTFRNEITLDSTEHMLQWIPEHFIDRLAPTPLLMIANGGFDPYHTLDQVQEAFRRAGEPKRLEVLPYDVLGLYAGPGKLEALDIEIDWLRRYLDPSRIPGTTALADVL